MPIYDRFINLFKASPDPTPVVEPEKKEDKAINFDVALPGYSDGSVYYALLNEQGTAYATNYVINKCINILAYNLSRLPLRIVKNGEPLPLGTELKGFNILYPHPRMTLSQLLYECGVYWWLKGEYMNYIDLETFLTLEPVDPETMKIKEIDGGIITSWKQNNSLIIPEEQLIYTAMMNPQSGKTTDNNRTLPLVEVIKKEVTNYASARDFSVQFFSNFAQLGLTLKDVEGQVSLEDRKAIVNEIDNKLARGRAYKTRFLPQGTDLADTGDLTMREMEFSQSLKDIRDIILGLFGVPRSVFGITNEVGLAQSTVEVEKRLMWSDTIQPSAHMIQEAFNQTLMRRYFPGYQVVFDYSVVDVLQDNMSDKADLASKYQGFGYTTNEINDKFDLGMEEVNDDRMNERFHPNTLIPYGEDELDISGASKAVEVDDKIVEIAKILEEEENKAISARKYRNRYNRTTKKVERKMASKLGRYFAEQLGKVLAIVKEEKTTKAISETLLLTMILNLLNEEKVVLASMMEPEYVSGSEAGSTLALTAVGSDAVPLANEAIVRAMTKEIGIINNYTYKLLKDQVKESVVAGETVTALTKRIQGVYKFNKSRVKTIARTESMKVVNRSADKEYAREGVEKKKWLSASDARDNHKKNRDEGVIPYNQAFKANGMMFPGDEGPASEVANCRCAFSPVVR